jgi:hypothetical protein
MTCIFHYWHPLDGKWVVINESKHGEQMEFRREQVCLKCGKERVKIHQDGGRWHPKGTAEIWNGTVAPDAPFRG